jgi:hypothetical protein
MGFYETENLPTFSVKNQQTYLQQSVQNLRSYQSNMIGPMGAAHTIDLTQTYSSGAPFALSFEQALNANQYRIRTPNYTGAFLYGGSGPLISANSLKRYYVCIAPNSFVNGDANNTREADIAVSTNYGFNNLPNTSRADTDRSITVQIPPYFWLAATYALGRGTELLLMFQNDDGTFAPWYLFRNFLDFMGPEGFPGPTSSAYIDQKGETKTVRFSQIDTKGGLSWT